MDNVLHELLVAYPIVDVMLPEEDYANSKLIKADNTVGAFDWALQFRWEPLASSSNRLPAHFTSSDSAEVFSPAAPGIFAVRLQYFLDLGMFDEQLSSNSVYGQENIELSIRLALLYELLLQLSIHS